MLRRTTLVFTIPLLSLAAVLFQPATPGSAAPSITIAKAEDPNDLNGGPQWLPPGEVDPADPGYFTDRSRHHNNDIYVKVHVTSNTNIQSVKLALLEATNPNSGSFSTINTVNMTSLGSGLYEIHTSSILGSPDCSKYYSFNVIANDLTSSKTRAWEKRGPGDAPGLVRRWVQLNCGDSWTSQNASGYKPFYLHLGQHPQPIEVVDEGAEDRFSHDTGTDGGPFDTGSMLREEPGSVEQRSCLQFICYWFDETVTVDNPSTISIDNAYYHMWMSAREGGTAPGASLRRGRGNLDENVTSLATEPISTTRSPTYYWEGDPELQDPNTSPVYGLATGTLTVPSGSDKLFSSNSIYELFFQVTQFPQSPSVISSRRTPSFVLLNVPSDIATRHSDSDGLTDAQELNQYFTSPFLDDTDGDGISDNIEIANGPNAANDPCNLKMLYPNGGELWTIGDTKVITFSPVPSGCVESRLFLQRGESGTWQELTSAPLAVGTSSFTWQVTGPAAYPCRIKEAFDVADPGDPCDSGFEIRTSPTGGCPFLYANQNGQWTELNTILASAPADVAGRPEADVVDRFVLSSAPTAEDGEYRFEIREFESERSWIDGVQLDVVDHPADTELGVTDKGELFLFGNGIAPDKAVDGNGVDRLADVMAADQRVFNGRAGDVLYLEYPPAADGAARRIKLITANKPPLESGSAGQTVGGVGPGIRASFDGPGRSTPFADARVEPRENLAPRWLDIPVSSGEQVGSANRIRVKLEWGSAHPLDFAGLVAPIDALPEVKHLALAQALSRDGTSLVGSLDIAASGGVPTVLNPGGKISLAFRADLSEPQGRRDFVFTSRGHYTHLEAESSADQPQAGLNVAVTPLAAGSPGAEIAFSLERADDVRIDIFSVSGRLVRTVSQGRLEAGRHAMVWDGRDADNQKVSAGVYFCQVKASQQSDSGRVLIAR